MKRKPLDKRLPREFRANAGKYIAIFLLLTATILLGSGFFAVSASSAYTLGKVKEDNKVEDGNFVTYNELDEDTIHNIEKLGLSLYENYYRQIDNCKNDSTLRIYKNREDINLTSIFEGELPKKGEIALDRVYAVNNDIKVGDMLEVGNKEYRVSALVALSDYNSLFKNNSDMTMDSIGFGVALVSDEDFKDIRRGTLSYCYSYYLDDRDLSTSEQIDMSKDIGEEVVKSNVIVSLLIADQNQSISFLEEDMGSDVPTMRALVLVLVAIMAFVFAIIIGSTIDDESVIIGTLRASGYSKHEIIMHYMKLPVIVTVVSGIIGNVLGYTVMIKPFKDLYYTTYSMPPLIVRFDPYSFVITTVVPFVLMIVINYFMLGNKLSLSPLKFLRHDLKKGKQKKVSKLPDISFLGRFRLRVLFQNKYSYLLLFFGIYLASILLMFGIGILPVINHYVDTIEDTVFCDYQYILKAPVECENGEKMTTYSLKTYSKLAKSDVEVTFYGIDEDSAYFKDLDIDREEFHVVAADCFMKKYDIKDGSKLKFKDDYYNKEYDITIDEAYNYKGTFAIFMEREKLNDMLDKDSDYFNGYMSDKELDIDEAYLLKTITKDDMSSIATQMTKSFQGMIYIICVFAIAIYLVLMYVLTKVVIEKNAMNISYMKVFGYEDKEIRKLYLSATTIVVVISLLLCAPLEMVTFKAILEYAFIKIDGYLEFYMPPQIYVEIILVGIISYLVINAFHVHKVKKIEMSDALKNRE